MYRQRKRGSRKFQEMAQASVRARGEKRLAGPAPDYPADLPMVRRRLIIEDYDFGIVRHEINMFRCGRVDCYTVSVDGQPLKGRYGWSKVVEMARKAFVRRGNMT